MTENQRTGATASAGQSDADKSRTSNAALHDAKPHPGSTDAPAIRDLTRERDQARGLACLYAAALAEIERLLREFDPLSPPLREALVVASGGGASVPLRTLIEWRLHAAGWERCDDEHGEAWRAPNNRYGWFSWEGAIRCAINDDAEREEAGGGPAEAAT